MASFKGMLIGVDFMMAGPNWSMASLPIRITRSKAANKAKNSNSDKE